MKKYLPLFLCIISIQALGQYANGKIKVYFDRGVDHAVAGNYQAQQLYGTWGDTLAAYINRATKSVDVACYDYTSSSSSPSPNNIATAINSAYSRGVTVRWIYNGSSSNTGLTLLNSGIKTLASPTGSGYNIMHDKFVIIDAGSTNPDVPIVWTGSPDWSQEMLDSDYNNIIIFQDSALAKAYTAQFNQMWGGTGASPVTANEKFGSHKADLGPHIFNIGGSEVELYFSPTDSTNDHILDVINSANSQLFFGVYTFTETNDATAIVARKNAGVYTAGVVDSYSSTFSEWSTLTTGLGTNLKEYVEPTSQPYCLYHNKYVIADACNVSSDPQVLTGSHNWTSSADQENDENTVIIHNADVANLYYQAFAQDFNNIGTNNQLTPCAVSNPCNISVTATVNSNVLCHGQSTGNATVHAHGTHSPFTYTWNSTPVQTDSVLSNVAAGTYTVTVVDANSCTATASVTITAPTALSVSVTETNVTCNGAANGTETANATGGTGAYQYKWNTAPQQTTITASNIPASSYTVTVTDANSCSASGSATITQPTAISLAGTVTNVTCLNGSNGKIVSSATGGTGSFQYLWSTIPQQSTATASNLAAGSYTVTATDAQNCTSSASFTVTQPNTGITLSTSSTNASCGTSNGSATVTATGGGSYTYLWSGGGSSATKSGLAAGQYSVTVSSGGCSATASVLVNSTGGPTIVASSTNTSCGNSNGSASVLVSGGTPPYSYFWSNSSTTDTISNLGSGPYTVTVEDNNHCGSVATITVEASNTLVLNATATSTSCNSSNGSATVTSNAVSPVYNWSNGGSTATINNIGAGNYIVTVTDAGSCSATASVTVGSSSGTSSFNITASATTVCYGDSANLCAITGYTTYQWSNNASGYCIYVDTTGSYSVTATNSSGCSATSTPISITVHAPFNITFGNSADTLIATAATNYQWQLNNSAITGATSETYIATQSGTYSVVGTDANGCSATSNQKYLSITGIENIGADNFVKVYPNPLSTGNWQLEVSNDWVGGFVEIYDAAGKLSFKTEVRSIKSEIALNLEQGIYLLKITSNDRSLVRKLIKL